MPTYFVTGATGFIGRHLVERLLAREGDIHVLVREGSTEKLDALVERLGGGDRIHAVARRPVRAAARRRRRRARRAARQGRPLLPPRRDLRHDRGRDAERAAQRRRDAERDRPRQRPAGGDLPPRAPRSRSPASTRATSPRTCSTRARSCPSPYHRTKFESEKLVRTRVQGAWRVYRPAIVVGDSRTGEMDKIDGPYYFFKAIQKARHALPRVVPARRPRGRLDEHRAGRLGRGGDRPHRAPARASTARRSTSSTRARSAPATCSTRSRAPATRRRW